MFRLMYSSVAVTALTADEMETLLGTSRRNNLRDGITGILLHVVAPDDGRGIDDGHGAFVQLLEGEEAPVEAVYARIERDDLHTDVRVLTRGPAAGRAFADWSMRLELVRPAELNRGVEALRDLDAMEHLIARYANARETAGAQPHPPDGG